jgi:KDO2-lipid IV(A) lauroyltransferase
MRTIIQALRNNQIVLITGDRAVQGESVEKPFFGADARLPLGPVALSQRTGAPLVGAFGWHASRTLIDGEFVPLTLGLPEDERNNTDALMNGLIARMERIIKAHPEQWVVFSPIWTTDFHS